MTMTVREILKQFDLELPLNENMLNCKIYGEVQYTGYHTEYHHNIKTKEKELVYAIEGTRQYPRGIEKIELLINPKTYKRGKFIKEMVDYNIESHTGTIFRENGVDLPVKQYIKNLEELE